MGKMEKDKKVTNTSKSWLVLIIVLYVFMIAGIIVGSYYTALMFIFEDTMYFFATLMAMGVVLYGGAFIILIKYIKNKFILTEKKD